MLKNRKKGELDSIYLTRPIFCFMGLGVKVEARASSNEATGRPFNGIGAGRT